MKKRVRAEETFRLAYVAEEALKLAVYEAIKDHERTGDPVAIWQNGRVAWVSAKKLKVKRPRLKYGGSKSAP